jgi:hypothetical protein
MEEWSDWVTEDNDPTETIRQMRGLLADRRRSQEDKLEALALLTNLADEDSMAVLRWYRRNADPGMEMASVLALMEADQLNRPPRFESWHDDLLEKIHEVAQDSTAFGSMTSREDFRPMLASALREHGWQVEEGGHALLLYEGQLIDLAPVDLVVNGSTLIGIWDNEDEENAWAALEDGEDGEEALDALDQFYATLRVANLPWGIHIDVSGDTVFTDMVENADLDRGSPRVEYVLSGGRGTSVDQ